MQDITELLFKVFTKDDGGLNKVDDAVKKIASQSGLTGQALQNLEGGVRKSFEEMTASGLTFEQALKRISQSGDSIGKGVAGNAKEIIKSLQDAAAATGNLEKQQKALQQASSGLQNAIGNPLQAVGAVATNAATAIGPVGIALAGLAAGASLGAKALFDLVDSQGRAAQATLIMAQQVGISAGAMRQMEVEARIVGLSFQSMMIASRNLAVGLEDPTGSGKIAAGAMRDLGVATQTAGGAVRAEGVVFQEAIEKLSGIENQSRRTEEATRLFGSRGAAALIGLVSRYKELKQAAEELGYGSGDQLVNELAKGQESINKLSAAWDLFKAKLAEKISPVVISVVERFSKVFQEDPVKAGSREGQDRAALENQDFYAQHGGSPVFSQLSLTSGQLSQARGTADPAAAGLALAAKQFADSMDRGRSLNEAFQKQQAGTSEGLAAALRANSEELKKVGEKLALGGLGGQATSDLVSQARTLESQRASLEAQKKSLEQSQAELARLRESGRFPDLESPIEFRKLIAQRQESLSKVGPANEGLVDQRYLPKIDEAIRRFFLKIGEDVQREAAKTVQEADRFDRNDPAARDYQKQLKDSVAISEAQYAESVKQVRILNTSDRDAARAQQQQAVKLAELGGASPLGGIRLGTDERIASAGAVRDDQLAQIKSLEDSINAQGAKSIDDQKQLAELTTQRLQTEAEYRKEIDAAQMDAAVRIAEYQKQQLDSYRQQGRDLFSALTTRGGLQQYGRSQAQELFGGIFANLTAPILQNIGRTLGNAGKATGLGDILKGTQLDPARGETPQVRSLDLNRASVDQNTNAVNKLSAVYSGTSVGGQTGTVQTGSVGDAMTKIAGVGGAGTGSSIDGGASSAGGSGAVPSGLTKFISSTLGSWITKAAGAGLGIYEGTRQLQQGGASGVIGAIGSFAGAGAALAPSGSWEQSLLSAVGLGAGLFKSLLPNPADIRAAQIANQTAYNQYVAPPVINQTLNQGGFQTYTDKTGLVNASSYSTIQETQPYKYLSPIPQPFGSLDQNWVSAPGQITAPYQTPAATPSYAQQPGVTYIINQNYSAIDSKSLMDHSADFAAAVQKEVQQGHPVALALQAALVGT